MFWFYNVWGIRRVVAVINSYSLGLTLTGSAPDSYRGCQVLAVHEKPPEF